MMMATDTPAAPHSSTIPGTVGAGVAMTARLTWDGTSLIEGKHRTPRTVSLLGFTRWRGRFVVRERFARTALPTEFSLCVAPMRATDSGFNISLRLLIDIILIHY